MTEDQDMAALLWSNGCDLETAQFVSRMLTQNGYALVKRLPDSERRIIERALADPKVDELRQASVVTTAKHKESVGEMLRSAVPSPFYERR